MEMHSPNPYTSTSKVGIHTTFFGKVMTFLALAVLASVGGVFVGSQYLLEFFFTKPYMMYLLFGLELVLIFTSGKWSTKVPLNRFLFAAFAFITGLTIAPLIGIMAQSPGGLIILNKALIATALMFTATALVGWTTKLDLSGMRGFLFMGLIGLIIVGIIGIFVPWSSTFELVFSGIGVALFSGFVMYDFQKIRQYPEDRYVDAALALYLDLFNLFLYILRFVSASSRD